MTPTYEQAIRCPRCGKPGAARAGEPVTSTGARQVTCYCEDKACPYYAHTWYLAIDPQNTVLVHTHTPYEEPATDD